jgi:WD40 repeat protein
MVTPAALGRAAAAALLIACFLRWAHTGPRELPAPQAQPAKGQHLASVASLTWSPVGGRRLAVALDDGKVEIWRLPESRRELVLAMPAGTPGGGGPLGVEWSPDGETLAGFSTAHQPAALWDSHTGRQKMLAAEAAWNRDGTLLATVSPKDAGVEIWDERRAERRFSHPGRRDAERVLRGWSPDGQTLLFETPAGTAFWRAGAGLLPSRLQLHRWLAYGFYWSPDSRWLATYGGEGGMGDEDVRLWDGKTGKPHALLHHHSHDGVGELQWRPDGQRVAVSAEEQTVIWDPAAGRRRAVLNGPSWHTGRQGWSGDGLAFITRAAVGRGGKRSPTAPREVEELVFWDVAHARRRLVVHRPLERTRMARDPHGRWLAADEGESIRIRDMHTGQLYRELPNAWQEARHLAWSPDGRFLASTSSPPAEFETTQTIVWDVATGARRVTLASGSDRSAFPAWSSDSRFLAVAGRQGEVQLWDNAGGQIRSLESSSFPPRDR